MKNKIDYASECKWAVHNIIGHPMKQLLWIASLFGRIRRLSDFSKWVHDVTKPKLKADI